MYDVTSIAERLLQPSTVLPWQYFDSRPAELSPEKRLMFAVLIDAVRRLEMGLNAPASRRKTLAGIEWWVFSARGNQLFSFDNVCPALEIAPHHLRPGLLQWLGRKLTGKTSHMIRRPPVVLSPKPRRAGLGSSARRRRRAADETHVKSPFTDGQQPARKPTADHKTPKLLLSPLRVRRRPLNRPHSGFPPALTAFVMRRNQLVAMLTAEKNPRSNAPQVIRRSIDEHIRWLEKLFDDELSDLIRATPIWREHDELLRSVPGVGTVLSVTLVAHLPELGTLTRKQVAALAG